MSTGVEVSKRHVSDNLLQHFRVCVFFVFFVFPPFTVGLFVQAGVYSIHILHIY